MTDDELRLRVAVSDLMTTYQYLADTGKVEQLADLFAPDGILQIGEEQFTGPDAILRMFRDTAHRFAEADFLPARHHLGSIQVVPRPDGTATTYACFQFIGARGLDRGDGLRVQKGSCRDGQRDRHLARRRPVGRRDHCRRRAL